jgi:hypothetical protein
MHLSRFVRERSFPEFSPWWEMGNEFIQFMSEAIVPEWKALHEAPQPLERVQGYLVEYLQLVYAQKADATLFADFFEKNINRNIFSGEFDALSYAFYRTTFETLAEQNSKDPEAAAEQRRDFTIQVGRKFFGTIHEHLRLSLPADLRTTAHFRQLQNNIDRIGQFLLDQGYLRGHCEFTFSVDVRHEGKRILQREDAFVEHLQDNGIGYALYIMGYPAILPSAVYLYQMFGEAQHHSSRTIEELFERVGIKARETEDFDPSAFPSDQVVELWRISV